MPAANRIRPKEIFTDREWNTLSARQSWRGPALIAHAWVIIALAFSVFAIFPNPATFVLAVMITGSRQLGISILMHDAAHGALHPNPKINDFLGHWFCAAPVGASLASYRHYHLGHHKYVQQTEDPDLALAAHFPVSTASLRRKIIRDLTGQTFLRQRLAGLALLRIEKADNSNSHEEATAKQAEILSSRTALRDHIIANSVILLILITAGYWWLYPSIWLVALATWFMLVTRIRNIAEHACIPDSEDPLAHARTTHASWWERLLIAPYWVHYHSEHHAFMHLPCYRLPVAHTMMKERGYGDRIPQCTSYRQVLQQATTA